MSFKFKKGDRFKVESSSDPNYLHSGTIVDTSFNSIFQDQEYVVKWDHLTGEFSYETVTADRIWEKINENDDQMTFGFLDDANDPQWKSYKPTAIYTVPASGTHTVTTGTGSFNIKLPEGCSVNINALSNKCDHQWKLYTGFTEEYQYCTKCGVKG